MSALHVSLEGAASFSVRSDVSFSFSETVARSLPAASLTWSTVPSRSNSTLPTFILTLIGCGVLWGCSVMLVPYCLLYCATCTCAILKYSPTYHILPIGEFN